MSMSSLNAEIKRVSALYPHLSIELLERVALKSYTRKSSAHINSIVEIELELYAQQYTANIAKAHKEAS